ncbi:hypothetical protein J2790_004427 [Paenarthrobacter nicotinovorans]|uniref:hypothetical protein n=1 Tax=Micrococcaceae TaxID=1268 RepID=UPI00047B8839|nr:MULTISPECIES: hypothetical protein [Micrococcaceae]MDR6439252.1 hypothetical protein [Paenarthrobacter nicotinovorans]SCZ66094.1 hypothetical protein SAMN02799638_04318 [Arthrobacter sp. UNCCL28]
MGRIAVALTLAGTAALLPGCYPQAVACPAIGHIAGVSVTVAAGYTDQVGTLRLKACQDGSCTENDVVLHPGATAVDQGCSPEGMCSATSSPDGTLVGFLELPSLSENPLEATLSGMSPAGIALPVRTLTFTPKGDYPYGEQCGRVISAGLILDGGGLRQQ